MAILASDLKVYLSENNPTDDSSTAGGTIMATSGSALKASFKDFSTTDTADIISSANADTAPIVITGRDAGGAIVSETNSLVGATLVTTSQTFERLLTALKSAITVGDIAIEKTTKERQNTVQGAAAATASVPAYLRLDSSASSSDDNYNNFVVRIPAGTGSGQIREIIDYNGATRRAYISRDWNTVPDSGDTFVLSEGVVLDKWPVEVSGCRRLFYASEANAIDGAEKSVFECVAVKNTHATLTLTAAKIQMTSDGTTGSILACAVESGLTLSASVANRLTPPTSVTTAYNESLQNIPGTTLPAGDWVKIWVSGSLEAGHAPEKATFTITTTGSST